MIQMLAIIRSVTLDSKVRVKYMSRIVPPMLLRALGRGVVGVVVGAELAIGFDSAGWTSRFFSTAGVAQVGKDHWKPVNDFS